jgi:hypothetical protein
MGVESVLNSCASSVDAWVSEQQQRSNQRKLNLASKSGDPKALKKQLEDQIKDCGLMARAIARLQDALKNAEPALAKLQSQAAKDEAALTELLKSGGDAAHIKTSTPFVVAMAGSIEPITPKANQAAADIKQLMAQMQLDKVLQEAMPGGPSDLRPLLTWLEDARDELEKVGRAAKAAASTLDDAFR